MEPRPSRWMEITLFITYLLLVLGMLSYVALEIFVTLKGGK